MLGINVQVRMGHSVNFLEAWGADIKCWGRTELRWWKVGVERKYPAKIILSKQGRFHERIFIKPIKAINIFSSFEKEIPASWVDADGNAARRGLHKGPTTRRFAALPGCHWITTRFYYKNRVKRPDESNFDSWITASTAWDGDFLGLELPIMWLNSRKGWRGTSFKTWGNYSFRTSTVLGLGR